MTRQDDVTTYASTDFSDLVKARRAELRLSLREVEERTKGPDGGEAVVKRGWLDNLEKGKRVIAPQVPQLEALSVALQLTLGRLQDAAGRQFFGIETVWSESGEARALLARTERMSPEQRDQLMRFLDTIAPST